MLSITLSLVAVFMPIAFMGGIVGRFLKSFGITMSATILVSMIVSFSLTPMLAARWLKLKRHPAPAGSAATAAAGRPGQPGGTRGGFYADRERLPGRCCGSRSAQRWVVVLCVVGHAGPVAGR